jgi:hypothetical protein
MLLLLLSDINNTLLENKPEMKYSLSELFEFFVGISEDKFSPYLEKNDGSIIPVQYIRLSSINEIDNTILKAKSDLNETDKNIESTRQKNIDGKPKKKLDNIKAPLKDDHFLLQANDYLITSRGNTRIILLDKYFVLPEISKAIVATQQFIVVRPKESIISEWGKQYLDFVIMILGRYFNERSEDSFISNMRLKEKNGYTLQYDKFEVGSEIVLLDKNGNKKEWENKKYYGVSVNSPYQAKVEFTISNNKIDKIDRSSLHIITIKELENITIIVNKDKNERANQAETFFKMKAEKDKAIIKYNDVSKKIFEEMISI